MAEDFVAARVVTQLVTEGGDESKQQIDNQVRQAEMAQRKLDAMQKVGGTRQPQTPAEMVATIAKATGEKSEDIQRALGIRGATTAASSPAAASRGLNMTALSKLSAVPSQGSMMGKLSQWQKSEETKALDTATKDETKQKQLLNKETGQVTKGLGLLGKTLGSEGMTALRLFGLGGVASGLIAGGMVATGAAAVGAARSFGGMANPGAGYRFDRAAADTAASFGRGMVPTLEYATQKLRQFGDIVASKQSFLNRLSNNFDAGMEIIAEATGFNAAADAAKGKSVGAAVSPYIGQFSSADDYYKSFARMALMQTPPGGTGAAAGDQNFPEELAAFRKDKAQREALAIDEASWRKQALLKAFEGKGPSEIPTTAEVDRADKNLRLRKLERFSAAQKWAEKSDPHFDAKNYLENYRQAEREGRLDERFPLPPPKNPQPPKPQPPPGAQSRLDDVAPTGLELDRTVIF